ncbi:alpha/beta fold hydrolase [Deinococcus sp. AJ005]|uniref:alpha/beta fold hydrolase n=1 Tax=Deinococcus sp. AJ005 TaxID=2652443 RepID=UPI00351ABD45
MSSGIYERSGVKMHYRVSGEGSPIVLVHGLSGSGRWWRRNLKALSERHRVYTLDLLGYGSSRRQRSLSVRESAALIADWLDAEDLQDITLIGHSMGGHICIRLAAGHPQRIENLVLVCASGLLKASAYRTALNLPRALITGRKRFVPRILTDALLAGPLNLWRNASDLLKDSVQDCLPMITSRTLVVWGERDALVPLPLGQMLAHSIAGARLKVIPHAGHVVMVDAPEEFNAAVLNFVDGPQAAE